jgi:hypothetical protein
MINKRLIVVVGCFALVVIVLACVFVAVSGQDVSKNTYKQLKAGMSKTEVRATFRGQPFDVHANVERWIGYDGCARLIYDDKGKLVWRDWQIRPYRNRFPESILQPINWPID